MSDEGIGRSDIKGKMRDARRGQPRGSREGSADQGQALLELAVITPFIFLLIVIAIDFGGWLHAWIEVGNAARAAANYSAIGPETVGGAPTPNGTAISTLLASELASLPNYSSSNPVVNVCWWNADGTKKGTVTGTCPSTLSSLSLASDNEACSFPLTVELTYTFSPLIPAYSFPTLGIVTPSLPTTVHRVVMMRFM